VAAPLLPGELDPNKQTIVAIVGRKRSGKSKYARWLAGSYPYDQVIIDLHGDDRPPEVNIKDSGWIEIGEVPVRWPEHLRVDRKPMVLYYQPDAGSPTLVEDMDALIGLAWRHGRTLVVVHEWGALALTHNQRQRPMTSRALSQGSKRKIPMILAMHRPYNTDRLTFSQADVVIVFETPDPDDRERIAKDMGWPIDSFEAAYAKLRKHEYLQFDRRVEPPDHEGEQDLRLLHYPPLSKQELRELERGAGPIGDYPGDHQLLDERP
jgi:hypothetical protein